MGKKYIFINSLILFFSLLIFLLISVYTLSDLNSKNTDNMIRNYLSIAESIYDGNNMEEVANKIHSSNPDVRVTFISASDGMVLYDTSSPSSENHLDRYEIKNIGEIAYRFSATTNIKMCYIAGYDSDSNVYIRLSIPESSITAIVNSFTYYGIAAIIILSTISFTFIYFASKKIVKPLKNEVNKLSKITNLELTYNGDDVVELSSQIESVRRLIDSNIKSIKAESAKLNYIIENMNSGIIIISGNGNIILVNSLALSILNRKKEDLENKSYVYGFVDLKITDQIQKAINEDVKFSTTYTALDKTYAINISSLYANFVMSGKKAGVAIFINDITEQKMLEKVKLDFFANASHELKSPLTSIIGYQQMISEGIINNESEIRDATLKTIKEATRMNQIIIEMLELSKLEMTPNIEKKELSIANACESVLESYEIMIKNKNLEIIKDYSDFNVLINLDDLYHLIKNLIENAIKYNVSNGKIYIIIDSDKKILSIKDTGIGISNENKNRIFERFYRVDKAKSKELGGTGLGLAIVKHICLNNNLDISVESSINEGSIFTVKFN